MLKVVVIMLSGVAAGLLFRKHRMPWIQKIITVLIWLLLFSLGLEVGSDKRIIDGFFALGLEAFFLMIGGAVGSVVLAWLLWRWVSKERSVR